MQPQRGNAKFALLILIAVSLASAASGADMAPDTPGDPWPLDRDGDRIDDALRALVEVEPEGRILVELHYTHRPTTEDVARIETRHDGDVKHVFQNWDSILVEVPRHQVASLADLSGVRGVESVPEASVGLDNSARAIRARPINLIADGMDHNLAVHTTLGLQGEGMVVAIIDTGVDARHTHLDDLDDNPATFDPKIVTKIDPTTGQVRFGGVDTSTLVSFGCIDPVDDTGHGTHVASIAVGTGGGPGSVYRGVAPKAKFVDVKVFIKGYGSNGEISLGLDWIMSYNAGTSCFGDPGADRIDVASLSAHLGTNNPAAAINLKVTDVVRSGVTFVTIAGNYGEAGVGSISAGPEGAILVGNADDANTVTRADDVLVSSSSRGPRPSDGDADPHDEKMPHVSAPGTNIIAADAHTLTGTVSSSGTSMSAPNVAGIAALILEANGGLTPVFHSDWRQMGDPGAVPVRDILVQTAQYKTAVDGPPPQQSGTGMYGKPWNNAWGYGLVDAYAAVSLAQSL